MFFAIRIVRVFLKKLLIDVDLFERIYYLPRNLLNVKKKSLGNFVFDITIYAERIFLRKKTRVRRLFYLFANDSFIFVII